MALTENTENIIVQEKDEGLRLDQFLAGYFEQKSRTYFQYLIKEGCVLKNGQKPKKSEKINPSDEIEVFFSLSEEISLEPENIPLNVLFEDEYIIAINKPTGMVVHPAPGNWKGTFVNALLYHCKETKALPGKEKLRPGIVHRLDKDTTGILIAAKTTEAQQKLIELFSQRKICKKYLAITAGIAQEQTILEPIKRDPFFRKKMAVHPEGKTAETQITCLAAKEGLSLVLAQIKTGRTHQIRVHLRHVNTPILGDDTYGFAKTNQHYQIQRPLLHAYQLKFKHPILGHEIEITAPLPDDFKNFIYKIDPASKVLD